ncbi:MAG: DUF1015 domain-containing protein, partial [Candidatus Thorarchaeota archaeon]
MVKVVPFKAYRYNKEKIESVSNVVSPPYDIIEGEKVDDLQSKSDYNIAWVIKNKPRDGDTDSDNQYTRASNRLNKWIEEDILKEEDGDCFYVYGQNFEVHGEEMFRFGFIGLLQLEDFATEEPKEGRFAGVLQHEETMPKDIQDRLNLSRECMAQFGQIFVIYPDHEGNVDSVLENAMTNDPIIDITNDEGIRHRIWKISDDKSKSAIQRHMEDKYVIIADGHHRYKTALALMRENPDLEAAKYRMLTFVNIDNPGLVVLATHRLVQNVEDFSNSDLLEKLKVHFEVHTFANKEKMFEMMDEEFKAGEHAFGLYMNDGNYYALILRDEDVMDKVLSEKSEELKKLDVSILHSLILDRMLGIDKEKLAEGSIKGGGYVKYVKDIGDAVDESIEAVNENYQAVFFMNPTKVEEVEAVSKNFECMPQKSTFF